MLMNRGFVFISRDTLWRGVARREREISQHVSFSSLKEKKNRCQYQAENKSGSVFYHVFERGGEGGKGEGG